MASYGPEPRAKVWMFYLKHMQAYRGRLSVTVIREICTYLADAFLLPQVTSTFLRFFDVTTLEFGPTVQLRTQIRSADDSIWVMLSTGRVLCSGGGNLQAAFRSARRIAYLISCGGAVEKLSCMRISRCAHGVIEARQIYVFGGCKL
jgi:hypothetical protein